MAKVQINDLDAATTPLDGTELVEIEQAGQSAQCTTQDIAALAGAPYLKYVALLSQADTDAPVATVLENTLGGAVVWTRDDEGTFIGTLAGAFTANKSICLTMLNSDMSASYFATYEFANVNELTVRCYDSAFSLADNLGCTIEIRVYP